jgi:hypothetical protein
LIFIKKTGFTSYCSAPYHPLVQLNILLKMPVTAVKPTDVKSPKINPAVDFLALLEQAKQHPAGSHHRNRALNQLIRAIAPKLWRTNSLYYPDALQQTWLYFSKYVCTAYDPTRASLVTWLNTHLQYRHRDLVREGCERAHREWAIDQEFDNYPALELPAREMGSLELLQQVEAWVTADPDQVLASTHLKQRPDVNCQALLLLRLPSKRVAWKDISAQWQVSVPTLSAFYQRKCLPYLREFGTAVGLY